MPWEAYHAQFELVAKINQWSEAEKAMHLAVSLKGATVTVLTNLTLDKWRSYVTTTAALSTQFSAAHQTELNRMRLKAGTRGKEETLAKLAEDVEWLVRLAYPDATKAMVEVLAKDQFTDALPEEDTRLRIRQNKPAALKDALRIALELDLVLPAGKQGVDALCERDTVGGGTYVLTDHSGRWLLHWDSHPTTCGCPQAAWERETCLASDQKQRPKPSRLLGMPRERTP